MPSAWAIARIYRRRMLPAWLTRQRIVRAALDQVRQVRVGASALVRPRVLLAAVPLGALYLLLGGSTLYLVVRGLSMDTVSWAHVLAVYFFSLAAGLILPLPVDIGVTEVGAVGAPGRFGVVMRPEGTRQLTYRGWPLYSYVDDTRPGQVLCDGVNGWFAVRVSAPHSA